MKYQWQLLRHRVLFEKYFRLEEILVSHELFGGGHSDEFTREIFERGAVVALLPYDSRRQKVVLIEQFRAGAITDADGPWLIESVAGVIDDGETEQQVAMRECIEEAARRMHGRMRTGPVLPDRFGSGRLQPGQLRHVSAVPGSGVPHGCGRARQPRGGPIIRKRWR